MAEESIGESAGQQDPQASLQFVVPKALSQATRVKR
jgi:hypothetical protein